MAFPTGWTPLERVDINITPLSLTGALSNYPLTLVSFLPTTFANLESDGKDLRIASDLAGTTELPRDLVSINTGTETIELHTKYPSLSHNSVNSLYIWGKNSGATAPAASDANGAQNVWNSDYKGVWHLNETGGNRSDSTANTKTLTDNNTVLSAAGKIGVAADFEESNSEWLYRGDNIISAYNAAISFSMWINLESAPSSGQTKIILTHSPKDGSNNSRDFYLQYRNNAGTYEVRFIIYTNNYYIATNTVTLTPGVFYNLVATYNGTTSSKLYVNAGSPATQTVANASYVNANNYWLGVGTDSTRTAFFDGLIDELRIMQLEMSADWIKADYNLQNSPSTYMTSTSLLTSARVRDMITTNGIIPFPR